MIKKLVYPHPKEKIKEIFKKMFFGLNLKINIFKPNTDKHLLSIMYFTNIFSGG